jgi:uncharacterized membrane protein
VSKNRDGDVSSDALHQGNTHIERAVNTALASFSPHSLRRLVLITDARETEGDVTSGLWRAQREGVRVFTVPADSKSKGDVWIETIETSGDLRAGEPAEFEIEVLSRSVAAGDLVLRTADGTTPIAVQSVHLDEGNNRFVVRARVDEEGFVPLAATVVIDGRRAESFTAPFWIGRRHRILLVEQSAANARFLKEALEKEGMKVEMLHAARLPDGGRLETYDAVILSDVPSDQLDESKMQGLERFVREGGGLVFVAGETSFGDSGFAETPLEEALPIRFQVEEKRKEVALVIVLDKSYSMEGEKIELAKEATKAALELLEETHFFSVVTFDWYPRVTIALQLAKDKERMRESISEIGASSPTRIFPALEKAYEQLTENEAKVKHIILLSDGKSQPDDFETLVTRMAEEEISVSTVAVGHEADRELLARIAKWGNGRDYFIEEATRVPEIFIKETQIATEKTLVEEPFHPIVRRRVESLRGIDFAEAPELRGFVSTRAKETADVLLDAASETEAPLLARWHYGLGKAVAFTSDAKNRWANLWLDWEGFGKFWAQQVREAIRRHERREIDFEVERVGEQVRVALQVVDEEGRYVNRLDTEAEMASPEGERTQTKLEQVGPGTYHARFDVGASQEGPYVFRWLAPEWQDDNSALAQGIFYPYPDEERFLPPDKDLLQKLSDLTGGKFDPEIADIYAPYEDRTIRPTALTPFLVGLALVLYIIDVAMRRAPWLWGRFVESNATPTHRT